MRLVHSSAIAGEFQAGPAPRENAPLSSPAARRQTPAPRLRETPLPLRPGYLSIGAKSPLACIARFIALLILSLIPASGPAQSSGKDDSAMNQSGLERARVLIRQGDARGAEESVRRYLETGNDSGSARSLLGLVLYQEGRWAESLAEFTRAAKFRTPTPSELIVVGLDYVELKDLANADRWMTLATRREPQNEAAWQYLGGIKYSENRFAEAIDAYDKSLTLHPRDVLVEDAIGRCFEGLSRDEDALAAYRKSLDWQAETARKSPQPLLHLGALLARSGKPQSALPLLRSAEALAPEDAQIHEQLGTAYKQLGQLKDAQSEIEKSLSLSPGSSHLHWLLASIYRKEGLIDKANREMSEYSTLLGNHSSDKLH